MSPSPARQAHHLELGERHLAQQALRQAEMLAHRELHVLKRGQRGEQRALLEQDAPAALDGAPLVVAGLAEIDAQHLDHALPLRQQADDRAQQHRLAAARAADEAEDLASAHVERQMIEHDVVAERRPRGRARG